MKSYEINSMFYLIPACWTVFLVAGVRWRQVGRSDRRRVRA